MTLRAVGANGGQAAAFTYDLARSVVYTRQGNPAWSGQERDGIAPIRSNDCSSAPRRDPQPDWVDLDKVAIPQADEQQRLLANLIMHMSADRKPLPRFWYLPRGLKAAVVMTGDDHGNGGTAGRFDQYRRASPPGCSVADWECVRGTSYIYPEHADHRRAGRELTRRRASNRRCTSTRTAPTARRVAETTSTTHSLPSRPGSRACPRRRRTARIASRGATTPRSRRSSSPTAFVSTRTTTTGPAPGSGPPRFLHRLGHAAAVRRARRHDDRRLPGDDADDRRVGPGLSRPPSTRCSTTPRADGYYGVFTANMHTDSASAAGHDAIVASAQARGVPLVSAKQMLDWTRRSERLIVRRAVVGRQRTRFTIAADAPRPGPPGDAACRGGRVARCSPRMTRNGAPVSFATETRRVSSTPSSTGPVATTRPPTPRTWWRRWFRVWWWSRGLVRRRWCGRRMRPRIRRCRSGFRRGCWIRRLAMGRW